MLADIGLVLAHRGQASRAAENDRGSAARCARDRRPADRSPAPGDGVRLPARAGDRREDGRCAACPSTRASGRLGRSTSDVAVAGDRRCHGRRRRARRACSWTAYEPWSACGRTARAHAHALMAEAAGRRDEAADALRRGCRRLEDVGLGSAAGVRARSVSAAAPAMQAALAEGEAIFASLGATPVSRPRSRSARQQQV